MFTDQELCNLINWYAACPHMYSEHIAELFHNRADQIEISMFTDIIQLVETTTPESRLDSIATVNILHLEVDHDTAKETT